MACGGWRHRDWATDYISLCLKAMKRELALVKTDQSVIPQDVNEATGLVMNAEVKPKDELSPLSSLMSDKILHDPCLLNTQGPFIDPSWPLIID